MLTYWRSLLWRPPGHASRTASWSPWVLGIRDRLCSAEIALDRVLLGGEGGLDAASWADRTGDLARASLLLTESPHVRFLEEYLERGDGLFEPRHLEATVYYRNAAACVKHLGHYFGHSDASGIRAQARAFAVLFDRMRQADPSGVQFGPREGHSQRASLPRVHETLTPGVYQLMDGAHRLAAAVAMGRRSARAAVAPARPTELQRLVLGVGQTGGRRELYQPIPRPDFDSSWPVVRRCADRFQQMQRFLSEIGLPSSGLTVLDLACSYGWFVAAFGKGRSQAMGVDRDPRALRVGRIAYGLRSDQVVADDLLGFARACERRFDVVLALSVLHHYALGMESESPQEVLRQLDRLTGRVLFLDSGQSHEHWFRERLPGWNKEGLLDLLQRSTTFRKVDVLGVDADAAGPYAGNYGRTLFALAR
jgi:hypothetical protein